ncbi:MAG: Prenyltransferase and squalene oxidase repeat protein [Schlesneria sp.]|nr:Prenyltransferase and squalene oxidase repeat protein [Schlesneria sp.]
MARNDIAASKLSRRTILKGMAAASCAGLAGRVGRGADLSLSGREKVLAYLESLARKDGGYGWHDQQVSHLSPTFATIASYRILNKSVPNPNRCAAYIRHHHPTAWKKLEQEHREFDYHQIQSLLWLQQDVSDFRDRVTDWKAPVPYLPQYERHRYPIFRFQLAAITCRQLLGIPSADIPNEWVTYLLSRRRSNGSFNNTPADDGSDGNILNTWWGLEALAVVGGHDELRQPTIEWVQACQGTDGGFKWQPRPGHGTQPDVAYTWAAIRSLTQLNARPLDESAVLKYLLSLRNSDGGFGDRPGWASNAVATRYALESLASLNALDRLDAIPSPPPKTIVALPKNLRVYTIQIEAHGTGSPHDAVALARDLKIDLWGAKNASPRWLKTAQAIADREKLPVTFFAANEEYGTWIDVPGFGTYSHMSDIASPAGATIGSPMNGQSELPNWDQFYQRRITPLKTAGGQLIWQFGENEELVRTILDSSIETGGYDAISTFHFGNPDFTNSEPHLNRYRGHLPFVALQDAHGAEPWWFADMTEGFRTLFLATEPTWQGWSVALRNNWVAAVRRDAITNNELRMHAGSDEVAGDMLDRQIEWRWWNNPRIARPMVSLAVLRPEDELEAFRPERGATIRVRCAWSNTNQGLLTKPVSEFKSLEIDGQPVQPQLEERRGNGMRLSDHAYILAMPEIAQGDHRAVATVKCLADGREEMREIKFTV